MSINSIPSAKTPLIASASTGSEREKERESETFEYTSPTVHHEFKEFKESKEEDATHRAYIIEVLGQYGKRVKEDIGEVNMFTREWDKIREDVRNMHIMCETYIRELWCFTGHSYDRGVLRSKFRAIDEKIGYILYAPCASVVELNKGLTSDGVNPQFELTNLYVELKKMTGKLNQLECHSLMLHADWLVDGDRSIVAQDKSCGACVIL